jgi:ABC-type multidrug transport system ATPase subunit
VERVCDHVAMMGHGRVVLCGCLEDIKASHHQFVLRFAAPLSQAPQLAGARRVPGRGPRIVGERSPSLDEIFVARATTAGLK